MTDTCLKIEDVGAVRILTLNRPEARNAINTALMETLYDALTAADATSSVRSLVLTGADPAFCAGLDLKEAALEGAAFFARHQQWPSIAQVARMTKPVIGAINGATFTGGLELALGCDILLASERAAFADTHARVGILPGGGVTVRLPAAVGPGWARRMSFTGEVVDAQTAQRIGLVTEVVPHEGLLERAVEIASSITEVAPETMLELKRVYGAVAAVYQQPGLDLERAVARAQRRPEGAALDRTRLTVTARNRSQINHPD